MSYLVKVECSATYEFVISLIAFMEKKTHTTLDLGTDWVKKRKKELPQDFITNLAKVRKLAPGFPVVMVLKSPAKTPTEFIKWLEGLSWSEIYELLLWFKDNIPLTTPQEIIEWKELICPLLRTWYDKYFSKVEEEIMGHLTKDVASINQNTEPRGLVHELSNGIRLDMLTNIEHVLLVPQYHYRPYNLYDIGQTELILGYPCRVEPTPGEPPSQLLRLTKAIADENRLKILKMLSQGPHTFTEIAEKMSIVKSTVHHHLVALRTAGLVWIDLSSNRNERFSLREEAVSYVLKELLEYLEVEDR